MDVTDKLANHLSDKLSDSRIREVALAHKLADEPYDVQARFLNTAIAYLYTMARAEQRGIVRFDLYDIAKLCAGIKEFGLDMMIEPEIYYAETHEYIQI